VVCAIDLRSPNLAAIVLAALAPTLRIPKPNNKRSTEFVLDVLIAFNKLVVAVSPNLSNTI
jgi:hypothetical protein